MTLRFIITSNWKKSKRENIKSPCRTDNILPEFLNIYNVFSYLRTKLQHGDLANMKIRSQCGGFVLTEKFVEI
jgi:hypothetical protein